MAFADSPTFRVTLARPSPLQRLAVVLVVVVAFVVGVVVILPLAILTAGLAVLAVVWGRLRRWVIGLRTRGPLDGRRNVRVIDRSN